ncbi:hypothetical protein K493DRAFT_45925 [Basidiobolus meristosporus CBS 931.73]|uniref:Dynactin subunit 2 n=1 Tax=Basidiobolus meristosporus CBS 931.73 TaxID=1314790 RepID=A0A1Y1Y291_9FUNG|nr:hypothetical protein K493DRAFT_45925 [Basidiobolus meristosporus CBS 931.73]|eukprot:ORX92123.1 hypothetical protein K493DRAFT_45925 [Basidiobolus meristosporus CBS 931.73]
MLSRKYATLPDLDTHPDVYETPDPTPLLLQEKTVIESESKPDVKPPSDELPKSLSRQKRAMYRNYLNSSENSELEILPTHSLLEETLPQRHERLLLEIQELHDEIQNNESNSALSSQVSQLQNNLSQLTERLKKTTAEKEASSLINQLKSFTLENAQELNNSQKSTTTKKSAEVDPVALTAAIEKRISALEKIIGTNSSQVISTTSAGLASTVVHLEEQLEQLVQQRQTDPISRRIKNIVSELDALIKLRKKDDNQLVHQELENRIDYLFNAVETFDPVIVLTQPLLNRLNELQSLHNEASIFEESIKMLTSEQQSLQQKGQDLDNTCKQLETNLQDNTASIQRNVENLDKKLTSLVEQVDVLSRQNNI